MKKTISSIFFLAIGIATPLTADAWTFTVVCEDGQVHQRETVSPDYFDKEDQGEEGAEDWSKEATEWYNDFADMICKGEA